ncbi:Uncharacterised protein [Mycobacteroides abscessus subsp. abscessus]|nr:Uncharacterised protein [Mycobacteroides abscessus subsp. abscessus]
MDVDTTTGRPSMAGDSYVPPLISIRSMPSAARAAITPRDSSSVNPPRWKSAELSLMATANPGLMAALVRRTISRTKRMRRCASPPQRSVRRLVLGDRNCATRYPCAP